MTEAEWNACTDPQPMLEFLRGKASDRKLRLFAVACCRVIWNHFGDDLHQIVAIAESFADGQQDDSALLRARDQAFEAYWMSQGLSSVEAAWLATVDERQPLPEGAGNQDRHPRNIFDAALLVAPAALGAVSGEYFCYHPCPIGETYSSMQPQIEMEVSHHRSRMAILVRCIFGPLPSCPITFDPAWLTLTVKGLAQAIYTDRVFDSLPILADALEDAGCKNADILNHCRQPGEHCRGCWVVDLLLGKE